MSHFAVFATLTLCYVIGWAIGDGFTPERIEALTSHIWFSGYALFAHWITNRVGG